MTDLPTEEARALIEAGLRYRDARKAWRDCHRRNVAAGTPSDEPTSETLLLIRADSCATEALMKAAEALP
jgi:hypothetical protein